MQVGRRGRGVGGNKVHSIGDLGDDTCSTADRCVTTGGRGNRALGGTGGTGVVGGRDDSVVRGRRKARESAGASWRRGTVGTSADFARGRGCRTVVVQGSSWDNAARSAGVRTQTEAHGLAQGGARLWGSRSRGGSGRFTVTAARSSAEQLLSRGWRFKGAPVAWTGDFHGGGGSLERCTLSARAR